MTGRGWKCHLGYMGIRRTIVPGQPGIPNQELVLIVMAFLMSLSASPDYGTSAITGASVLSDGNFKQILTMCVPKINHLTLYRLREHRLRSGRKQTHNDYVY